MTKRIGSFFGFKELFTAEAYLNTEPGFILLQDGQISAEELQTCLTQANFSGGYKRKTV